MYCGELVSTFARLRVIWLPAIPGSGKLTRWARIHRANLSPLAITCWNSAAVG